MWTGALLAVPPCFCCTGSTRAPIPGTNSVHASAGTIMCGPLISAAMVIRSGHQTKITAATPWCGDIAAMVRELVLPPLVLIGMSMGGANAMTYAARYPTTVKALVLVDVGPEVKHEGVDNIRRLVGPQAWPSLDAAVADVQRFNPRRSLDNIRQRLSHSMRQLPSGAWTWKVDEVFRNPNRPRQRDTE